MTSKSCGSRQKLDAPQLLRENNLKVTEIRVLLLTLLHAGPHPQSAEDLFDLVCKAKSRKTTDLVSIYRNLKKFLEVGLIQKIELGTGRQLYEWREQNHHHHHIICQSCSRVDAVEICGLDSHLRSLKKMGYANVEHRLEFYGTCGTCRKGE